MHFLILVLLAVAKTRGSIMNKIDGQFLGFFKDPITPWTKEHEEHRLHASETDEHNLLLTFSKFYNPANRPVFNKTRAIDVEFNMALVSVYSIVSLSQWKWLLIPHT